MGIFGSKKGTATPSDDDDDPLADIFGLDDDNLSSEYTPSYSYDDDFMGEEGEFVSTPPPQEDTSEKAPEPKKKKKWPLIAGSVVAVILVLIIAGGLAGGGGGGTPEQEKGDETSDSRIEGSNQGVVVEETVGTAYEGSGDGNPKNGTGAILAFDYDYYVNRDGDKAREHFNPDATSYDGAFIQSAIDKVPQGTKHSLSITPERVGDSYNVILTINIPDSDPFSYEQKFTVMERNGEFFVKSFTSKIQK